MVDDARPAREDEAAKPHPKVDHIVMGWHRSSYYTKS